MSKSTITLIIVIAAGVFGMVLGSQLGADIEDIDAYEQCIKEQHGKPSAQVYQETGVKPKCNR